MKLFARLGMAMAAAFFAGPAIAATSVVYNTVPAGQAAFDATLTGAGGVVKTQVLAAAAAYTDFTISKAPITTYSQIVGTLTDIAPQVIGGSVRNSGVKFTFSTAVNSFGLNVGDWGTCCLPSALFIAFDGGAPILVGTATNTAPAPLTNGSPSIFVGAFDDTNTFSSVEFWGDGIGEVLYAGGTIRYGAINVGSLPAVPEPSTWAMMMVGFAGIGMALRQRRRVRAVPA